MEKFHIGLPIVENLIRSERESFVEIRPVLCKTSSRNSVSPKIKR